MNMNIIISHTYTGKLIELCWANCSSIWLDICIRVRLGQIIIYEVNFGYWVNRVIL